MDPLSAIGGIQATGAIVAVIVQTLKNLSDARSRFQTAGNTLRLLISELTAIKAAVLQIEDWAKYSFAESTLQSDLNEAFRISFDGCAIAMDILSKEVDGLMSKNPFLMKAKITWTETTMKEHADRLRSQVAALQLLIQAANCSTRTQQAILLEAPSSRSIIKKVASDASTLRASRAYTRIGSTAPSVVSHEDSTISSATFGVDHELVNTTPYKRAKAHQEEKQRENTRSESPNRNPFLTRSKSDATHTTQSNETTPTIVFMEESRVDSGFYDEDADIVNPTAYREAMASRLNSKGTIKRSISAPLATQPQETESDETRDNLTPMERFRAGLDTPQKYNPDPIETHLPIRPVHHQPSRSDSSLTLVASPDRSPELKKSPWGTLKRLTSRTGLARSSTMASTVNTEGMRLNPKTVRRKTEINIHQSIDFGSEDGLSAPAIVRAAQSASRVEIERLIEQRADIEAKHEPTGRSALAVASHCGNEDIVSLLLHHRARTDVKDATGMAPLHLAASRGHYRVVQQLLEDQADVDIRGDERKTPLRLACDNGHFDCCSLLLQYRAKVNARDERMVSALHAAAKIGDLQIVELLLKNGADPEAKDAQLMSALHYAAEGDFETVVQALLLSKADIESRGSQGKTPLCSACASGSFQTASLLISRKANIKHRADKGMTALHFASSNDRADTAELLLQQKRLTMDCKDDDGRTPLHHAVITKSFSTAELLVRRGASIETPCSRSLRPLHYAADNADDIMTTMLLGSGASPNAPSQLGWHPLHFAAARGAPEPASALLRAGAQPDAFTHAGDRALALAASNGHLAVARLLLDRGSAMHVRVRRSSSAGAAAAGTSPTTTTTTTTGLGDSPLCRAARAGHTAVCEELLRRGASALQRDELGWPPLRCAAYNGHVGVVRLLLGAGATVASYDGGLAAGDGAAAHAVVFGWAPDVDERARRAVVALLRAAEERERTTPTRVGELDPYLTVLAHADRSDAKKIYEIG